MVRLLIFTAVVSTALACAPSSAPTPAPPSGGGGGGGAATTPAADAGDQIPTGSNPEQLNSNNEQHQSTNHRLLGSMKMLIFFGIAMKQ
uniref:Secreted protein n=1 Tax=Angiostrongylus cantonensis TaxID=6313 RepID=A0A0K0DP74_ANGCA